MNLLDRHLNVEFDGVEDVLEVGFLIHIKLQKTVRYDDTNWLVYSALQFLVIETQHSLLLSMQQCSIEVTGAWF